ncbi:hypothetical protein VR44_07175 [Streptomyces katrae]|uniref:Uncharacterized protein n=1 Tax=Streptomyces katrae TaxID=68223 RepID=A0A0F4JSJ4_9ACTN|nr:hypothetical protein VR44_07175 [Streptomyces katrae]
MFAVVMGVLAVALALAGPVRGTTDRAPGTRAAAAVAAPPPAVGMPAERTAPRRAASAWPGGRPGPADAERAGRPEAGPGTHVAFAGVVPPRGPSCAPDSGGLGTEPAVPASRAGHEHGSVLVARAVPEGCGRTGPSAYGCPCAGPACGRRGRWS